MSSVAGAAAGFAVAGRPLLANTPAERVAIAKCTSYGADLTPTLNRMFDQLGGLGRIVAGKTVAIKVNLTGSPDYRLGYLPAESAHWTHPRVIGATAYLMHKAGAKRVRILECPWSTAEPLEEYMMQGGWDITTILNAAPNVEMENTNYLGSGKQYSKFTPPNGGYLFREYYLNHSYEDTDVFVSMAKLKDHATAGVTLSMKNCFGMTPCTIYGEKTDGEPLPVPQGGRGLFHDGTRQPAKISPPENDPKSSRQAGYRVPRAVADLVAARPIHLAIIDGIESMVGGEGPWNWGVVGVKPGILVAGTNCVNTDAVAMATMGYDPAADRGKAPFEHCDSTLALAEHHGVGSRDMSRIEVVGTPIAQVKFDYRETQKKLWKGPARPAWS